MAASSNTLHEPDDKLSSKTVDMHRALTSLQEELEAVDWYRQRADACGDGELREILLHNMREEVEHACMILEWLRRRDNTFADHLATYLFTEAPITEVEAREEQSAGIAAAAPAAELPAEPAFTIGGMKEG